MGNTSQLHHQAQAQPRPHNMCGSKARAKRDACKTPGARLHQARRAAEAAGRQLGKSRKLLEDAEAELQRATKAKQEAKDQLEAAEIERDAAQEELERATKVYGGRGQGARASGGLEGPEVLVGLDKYKDAGNPKAIKALQQHYESERNLLQTLEELRREGGEEAHG